MHIRAMFVGIRTRITRFCETQGFAIAMLVCVGMLTFAAVWHQDDRAPLPPPSPEDDLSVVQLQQEPLSAAASPTPAPQQSARFLPPLDHPTVLAPFSASVMQRNEATRVWQIHDAVDLRASPGTPVYAMADGIVTAVFRDKLWGGQIHVVHGGITAAYAGLEAAPGIHENASVAAGTLIGHTEDSIPAESGLGAHLHLRVTRSGNAVDPMLLWDAAQ